MKKKVIQTDKAPKAIGPYSQAIQAGNFLFLSGQIPLDPKTGELVKGDIRQQTRQVLENIKGVLESQNVGMEDVVKVTIFLKDIGNFNQVNEAYAAYFPSSPPARSTVEIARLPRDAEIEIEAIALMPAGLGRCFIFLAILANKSTKIPMPIRKTMPRTGKCQTSSLIFRFSIGDLLATSELVFYPFQNGILSNKGVCVRRRHLSI